MGAGSQLLKGRCSAQPCRSRPHGSLSSKVWKCTVDLGCPLQRRRRRRSRRIMSRFLFLLWLLLEALLFRGSEVSRRNYYTCSALVVILCFCRVPPQWAWMDTPFLTVWWLLHLCTLYIHFFCSWYRWYHIRKWSPLAGGVILVHSNIYVQWVDRLVDLKRCVTELQISANPGIPPEFSLEIVVSRVSLSMLSMMSFWPSQNFAALFSLLLARGHA